MTILLVDDHAIVLEGLRTLIHKAVCDVRVLSAADEDAAKKTLADNDVDVVVTDLELKGGGGLSLIAFVHDSHPHTKVVVYTMHEEPWTIREIADSDADAVVMKSDDTQQLVNAIKAAADGCGYYSTTFARLLAAADSHPNLSEREMNVLTWTAQGLSTSEIAERLSVSPNTVEFHRRRIRLKLGAANAAETIKKATDMGWNVNI